MSRRRKKVVKGKAKGRVLYRVDHGHGYSLAQLHTWTVSSIKRRPRGRWTAIGPNHNPVTVYLTRPQRSGPPHYEVRSSCRADFPLDEWPGGFSASKAAAWGRAVKAIDADVERTKASRARAKEAGDDEWRDECNAELRVLGRSRAKAVKAAVKGK